MNITSGLLRYVLYIALGSALAQSAAVCADTATAASNAAANAQDAVTGNVESKHTYFRKVDDMLVGVGYYAR